MSQNSKTYWTYSPRLLNRRAFPDPRIAIARHIGWEKYAGPDTVWPTPEPDNYNAAVFNNRPLCCDFIENQVIYWDQFRQGWMTVLLVTKTTATKYAEWLAEQEPLAHWYYPKAAPIRPRRSFLRLRGEVDPTKEMTLNERLYTMGYFKTFQSKYCADTTIVSSRLGMPRGNLTDLIEDQSSIIDV